MKTKDFEYSLPKDFIAQRPIEPRDASKLLVMERKNKLVKDDIFRNIVNYLEPGDLLVLNDTKVIPARLFTYKRTGGKVEVFLLRRLDEKRWEALIRPGKRVPPGTRLRLGEDVEIVVLERKEEGSRLIEFSSPEGASLALTKYGKTPLPPYIKEPLSSPERYQTIYAKEEGSVAAPTAALHFTHELLKRIKDKGIGVVYITLHMGWGSFRLIKEEILSLHKLPPEYYRIEEAVAKRIKEVKEKGKRVIACGTDVVRALETASQEGELKVGEGESSLFITPGYRFKVVDVLITNLHLPRSSHLVLVSAFAGREFTLRAYQYAMKKGFRFYTFGDATIVI
jgi:S-adenosylmethionine:tRNA ribosyltransferase-isomerase